MKPKSTLRSFLAIAGSSLLTITYASAAPQYWDADGDATPGFGIAAGTWSSAGTGNLFSTSPTGDGVGGSAAIDYITLVTDDVNFGTPSLTYPGAITISGTVTCNSIYQCPASPSVVAGALPAVVFGPSGSVWQSDRAGGITLPAMTLSGAAAGLRINMTISETFNVVNITNNMGGGFILGGPGRLAISNPTQLGTLGQPLVFDGGMLRLTAAWDSVTYPTLSSVNAVNPVSFTLNKDAGFDNLKGSTTFTLDQPINLGSGVFKSEGTGTGIIKLTLPHSVTHSWSEIRLQSGVCEIDNLNQLGPVLRFGSGGTTASNGTLKILGLIPDLAGITLLTTADKGVAFNIDSSSNTFTVNKQILNTGASGGFSKSGAGTLILNHATYSNSYAGGTTVSAGTMDVLNIPAAVSGVTSVSGTGILNLSTDNSAAVGGVTISGGTLNLTHASALGTGPFTLGSTTGILTNNFTTVATTHPVTFGAGGTWAGLTNLTFGSGAISLPGSSTITLNGTGSTLTFGGVLTNTNAGNPTLTVNGFNVANTLVISGGFDLSNSVSNRIPVIAGSGKVTINGPVTNGTLLAPACGLSYTGTGTLTLNGANTHDGLTLVNNAAAKVTLAGDNSGAAGGVTLTNGTLNINSNTALGTGTTTLTAGFFDNTSGSLKTTTGTTAIVLNGNTTYSGTNHLTLGGPVQLNASRTITLNGASSTLTLTNLVNTQAGNPVLTVTAGTGNNLVIGGLDLSNTAGIRTVTVQGTANTTVTGAVRGSSFGGSEGIASPLVKSGTGTLTLQGNNIYTGATTVNTGGCLALVGGSQSSAITVASGGFLGFTLGSPTTSTAACNLQTGHKIRITGTPALASYTLITAASIGGTGVGTPTLETAIPGYSLKVVGTSLRLVSTAYDAWATLKGLTGANRAAEANPDNDSLNNLGEFAFNGDPTSGSDNGMIAGLVQDASLPAGDELTLVVAVRDGATFANAGTPVVQTATVDAVTYTIEGTLDLVTIPGSDVSHPAVGASDTAPAATGLPDLTGTAWEYHTFKLDASEGLGDKGFLRAKAE